MRNDERRRILVERVFRRDGDRLWAYVAGMLHDAHEAEDILQEVLMKALTTQADLQDVNAMRAYLLRSARNAAIDFCRRRKAVLVDEIETPAPSLQGQEGRNEELSRLSSALGALTVRERDVLLLKYDGRLTYAEIALQVDEPLGTVLARSHRALRKLARLMRRKEGE